MVNLRKENGGRLGDRLNVIFFDLVKIRKLLGKPPEQLSKLEKWGLFLSYTDDEAKREYIDSLVKSEEGIMHARSALLEVSQDDINWAKQNTIFKSIRNYNSGLEGAEKIGEQRGLEQGRKQGEHKRAVEIARNLLKMGLPLKQVAAGVCLTVEEIKALQ